jgi:hypothetical protein
VVARRADVPGVKRRIAAAVALAAALAAGVAGCGAVPGLGGAGSGAGDPTGAARDDGRAENLPERTVYLKGEAGNPSAGQGTGAPIRGPIASLSPFVGRTGGYTASPSSRPTECTGQVLLGVVNGADVVPGTTSATVTWWNIGDPAITEFRVAAVTQQIYYGTQPPWTWQSVAPGGGCTRLSTTVTGLTSGAAYVFVVHALLKKYETLPPTAPEVARSDAVKML